MHSHAEGRLSASLLIDDAEAVMERADVILTLHWPGFGTAQTLALAAMGSGKPVVVLETEASADWPMLDPQTWRARGVGFTPACWRLGRSQGRGTFPRTRHSATGVG